MVSRLKRHSCRRCGGLSTQNMLLQASGSEAAQPCPTLCNPMNCSTPVRPHKRQPTRLPHPWDSPGKNTEVGCHCLLRCESEVTQSCLTLCNPMDCSPPGSSVHGILQARILKWVALPSSMGSSRPGDRTCVSHISCTGRWVPYHLRQQGTLDSTWLVAKTRTEHSIQGSVLTRFS